MFFLQLFIMAINLLRIFKLKHPAILRKNYKNTDILLLLELEMLEKPHY